MESPLEMESPTLPHFQVFISHAGEDKATIAVPLRDKLDENGITAFVDEKDMPASTPAVEAMTHAMTTADVGVIVLSPEFVARTWPIKELLCFLRRNEEAAGDAENKIPAVVPVFYRLSLAELFKEPRIDRMDKDGQSLYLKARFYERMESGEPEANVATIRSALHKLRSFMGVRNDLRASNDDTSYAMSTTMDAFLQRIVDATKKAIEKQVEEPLDDS